MSFWNDYLCSYVHDPERSSTYTTFYLFPDDWADQGHLLYARQQEVLNFMYGPTWREGNGDGSKYVILKMLDNILTPEEVTAKPWLQGKFSCYKVSPEGSFEPVEPDQM